MSIVMVISVLSGCTVEGNPADTTSQDNETLNVVASFYPLAYLTQEIAGDAIEVVNLVPAGGEPHDYEPSVKQMAQIENADLFIFQGAGLEPWVETQEESLEEKCVHLLEVASHLDLLKTAEEEHHDEHEDEGRDEHDDEDHDEHEEEEREEDHHHHGEYDPHTWLDPILTIETIRLIKDTLSEADSERADVYAANANTLIAEFSQLDEDFKSSLNSCEIRAFITSHDAFQYLAHRYELEAVSVSGISPHDEPSAVQIAELVEHAKEENITHIFFEVLANSKTAETLANEAGLEVLVLDPIAGLSNETAGETYVTLMGENLENLKTGLRCTHTQ